MSVHLAWAGGGDDNGGAKSANDAKAAPRDITFLRRTGHDDHDDDDARVDGTTASFAG